MPLAKDRARDGRSVGEVISELVREGLVGRTPNRGASRSTGSARCRPVAAVTLARSAPWYLDIGAKRAVYEAAGVAGLWLVDWPASTVLVHWRSTADVSTFDLSTEVGPGEVLTTPLLEGLTVATDALFA